MTISNGSQRAPVWQVDLPAVSPWQRIVQEKPLLSHLESGIRRLDPPLDAAAFWKTWHPIEPRLAQIFDGPLRPPIGTDHDRAWNHLFVAIDDLADRRAA